jgi:hypothetical protein
MTNFAGQPAVLPTFTADNFDIVAAEVPEPSSLLLLAGAAALLAGAFRRGRRGD